MVTENSDNTDEVVEETTKKTKAKKPKYDAVQELPEVFSDMQQYVFTINISSEETKKYYISYYMKNEHGSTSIQFKTWDEGIAFCSALDSNPNLDSRSFLKRIK